MFFCKKRFLILTLTSIFLGMLQVSCIRSAHQPQSPGVTEDATGDFKALEVTGTSVADQRNGGVWTVVTEKTYQFRVCLISRTTNAPLPVEQSFRITKTDKTSWIEVTDNLGCLKWKEAVPFNFSADSTYIEMKRTISGEGTYRGVDKLRIAVNPWMEYRQEIGPEVVDLDRNEIATNSLIPEVGADLSLAGRFSRGSGRSILIDTMPQFKVIPTGDIADGKKLKIILRMKPFIRPLKMNGDPGRYEFSSGRFRIFAQLVANYLGEDADKHLILTPDLAWKEVDIAANGELSFIADAEIKRRVSMGQIQLALKIVPVNAPFPLEHYEGLHNIGDFDELFAGTSAIQASGTLSEEAFDYSNFIEGASNFEALKNANWAQDLPPVYYSPLAPRFVRVASGETATTRTIIYSVSTQVTDSVTGKFRPFQPFTVTKSDGRLENVVSDFEGRIRWMDEIYHHYYKPEQYYFPKFTIKHTASKNNMNLTLALNPWDEGWTFGEDIRGKEAHYKKMSEVEVREPLLMVDAFRYQTIRFRYVIDEFLTLNVKKAVVMALDPLVQRFAIKEGRRFEPLRDGIYLAKISLVKYYIDPFQNGTHLVRDPETNEHHIQQVKEGGEARKGQYTTVIKKLLRVQAGRITTPVEFSMRDLRMMSIRSNIMVQLETIDEHRLLRDNIVEGKMRQLLEEHVEYEAIKHALSAEEKEAFFKEKEETFMEEQEVLKTVMSEELAKLREQRDKMSEIQFRRFEVLSELEDSMSDAKAVAASQLYRDYVNLPQEELQKWVKETISKLDVMHYEMEEYWQKWEKQWLDNLAMIDGTDFPSMPPANAFANKSYLDYLGVMQTFMTDFGVPDVIGGSDFKKFQLNNYTANPAAPFVDLNLYRNESGLKRRTFIGPCTLVENDNMSEMRPTDTIDEKYCDRIDCGEELYEPRQVVDNSVFENSAHHDSLKPFTNMHVDEVIDLHIQNEARYEREMDALSKRANFVESFNLEYVSLTDDPLEMYQPGCSFQKGEECYGTTRENVTLTQNFLSQLNQRPIDQLMHHYFHVNSLDDLLATEKEIERDGDLEGWLHRSIRKGKGFLSSLRGFRLPYSPEAVAHEDDRARYLDHYLGGNRPGQLTTGEVEAWLNQGTKGLQFSDSLRICQALTSQSLQMLKEMNLIKEDASLFGRDPELKAYNHLLESCFEKTRYLPERHQFIFEAFSFDRRYKVLRTGAYEHIAGMNMNINVGIDFGINSYSEINNSVSAGANGVALLGIATAGVGVVTGNPLLVGAGLASFGGITMFSGAVTDTEGVNSSQATSVNNATFLVLQKAEMEIVIEEHEKCLTTQFTPNLINNLDLKKMGIKSDAGIKDLDVRKALGRGFMICAGVPTLEPEKVRENYYYVTQHFTAGDMLDDANLLNHVWLLALRGKRDFNTFIRTMNAKKINNEGEVIPDGDVYDYSIFRLGKIYEQVIPTFPGFYTVPD